METEHIDAYRKTYRLRLAQGDRTNTIEVIFPYPVIEKEARKRGMKVEEFIKKFQAVALYNGFDGVIYQFEEIPTNGK